MALRKIAVIKTLEIPHEPGESMSLRQLGWYDLQEAARARRKDAFDVQREMGRDLLTTMQQVRAELGEAIVNQASDALQQYDLETLLRLGIEGWSYPEPVTEETIRCLDPVTAEWAGRQIIGADETPADRKNDSGGSTSPSLDGESRPTSG